MVRRSAVALFENIDPHARGAFNERGHEVETCDQAADQASLCSALATVEVLGIRSRTRITAASLAAAPNLLAIGCYCLGTNHVDLRAARERGIVVFNAPYSNTRSVAELTLAEIIALHRRLTDRSRALHEGAWEKTASGAHEVRGRTLGIVGYGHIGSQLSILAEALGMRVIYYDIASKLPLGNAVAAETLDDLLARSDVVSMHVPETQTTRGMIGERELRLMQPGAFLINNARGVIVDLDALANAIRAGMVSGAAVDVFPCEPSDSNERFTTPLAGLPNVILTPHIGGSTHEAQVGIARDVTNKIVRFLKTGSTTSAVNLPEVDLPLVRPKQSRILHFHRNVPGVLSKMHRVLADRNININAEYLQSDADVSYVILDVDPFDARSVRDELEAIPETIRLRFVETTGDE